MGTHPIFESDFDCLTEGNKMARKKSPPKKKSRVAGEIKKLQRSTDLLIRKAPFCRLVKEITISVRGGRMFPISNPSYRMSSNCNRKLPDTYVRTVKFMRPSC